MSNETMSIWLTQGEGEDELRMSMVLQKEVTDKMGEIASRYPVGYWDKKQLDLLDIAREELEIEKAEKEQQSQQ